MKNVTHTASEQKAIANGRQPGLGWQIAAAVFFRIVLNTARRFVYPFAPALGRGLHAPLTAITSLIAVTQASTALGLLTGPLADRWGYRRMMVTGMALLSVGMTACWIAPVYGVVFWGLLLAGAGKTAFDPAVQAFISNRVPYARRATAIGAVETAWAGSTLVGIPTIALVIHSFGLRWSFFTMGCVGAAGCIMLARMMPPDGKTSGDKTQQPKMISSLLQLVRIRSACSMLGFGFLISMANDNLFVVYGAWLERDFGIGIVALGLSTGVLGAAELTGEAMTALLGDRIGLKRAMFFGAGAAAVGYALLPLIGPSLFVCLSGLFVIFCAYEFTVVCSFSLGTELLPMARATMMAGFFAAAGLGRMAGALCGGALWPYGGLTAVSAVSSGIMVLAMICLFWGLRHWRIPA